MSIVQAFLPGVNKYDVDDAIVVYFCFPTLGVSIPLRPGDYLFFNPLIPHCVSFKMQAHPRCTACDNLSQNCSCWLKQQ